MVLMDCLKKERIREVYILNESYRKLQTTMGFLTSSNIKLTGYIETPDFL
jgi:hypothetical protein